MKLKHFAVMVAAASLAVGAPAASRAKDLQPKLSPVRAKLVRSVSLAALAASRSNAEALAALAHAKPVAPLPRLLPNGKPAIAARPDISTLPRPATNTQVAGVTSIGGFTGIYEGANAAANGSELEPPDQGMAVNRGVVGEIVNNTIQFFRGGQPLTNPVANYLFFNSGTVANLSDPHILYDASVSRWFVDELTYSGPLGYGFYVAVSTSSDPTGTWNVYFVNAFSSDLPGCGSSGCLPDYPQVGYDANGYYIDADLFGPVNFVAAAIYALPKSLLVSGKSFVYPRFTLPDFVVQPAVPAPGAPFSLAYGGREFFLTARNIYNGSDVIRLWQVRNTFNIVTAPSTLTAVSRTFKVEPYGPTVPSTQPNVIGPYGRSKSAKSAPLLDGGYNSFGANAVIANGKLWAALTTGSTDSHGLARDIVAWFAVSITTDGPAAIADQGYVVPPDGYSISYPDLALNRGGYGYMGFSITNPDKHVAGGFPSTAVVRFARGNTGSIMVTGQGGTSDDGFTGYFGVHNPGQVGRWGDYGQATVDPSTGIFYTANEFIPDPNVYPRGVFANWGTFVTAIKR